jgi:flagellar protein FlgJ
MVGATELNTGIASLLSSVGTASVASYVPWYTTGDKASTAVSREAIACENSSVESKTDEETTSTELKRLKQVCREFEAIFLHQLFKIMRQAGPKSDLLDSGLASDVYNDMLDEQLATEMSATGDFGLADVLYEQMKDQVLATATEENKTVEAK